MLSYKRSTDKQYFDQTIVHPLHTVQPNHENIKKKARNMAILDPSIPVGQKLSHPFEGSFGFESRAMRRESW